jgi:hypothetical protein
MRTRKKPRPAALLVLILLILGLLALVTATLILPARWSAKRSVVIQAPVAQIQPLLANLHFGWPQWSTFDREDPNIVFKTVNPSFGVGGERSWTSRSLGHGSQKITEADAGAVRFIQAMPDRDLLLDCHFLLEAEGSGTKLTWTEEADSGGNFVGRYWASRLDPILGPTMEQSLAKLKTVAEANAQAAAKASAEAAAKAAKKRKKL